jgi:hypothetical protein
MLLKKILLLFFLCFIGQEAQSYSYNHTLFSDTTVLDSVIAEFNEIQIKSCHLKKALDKFLGKTKNCHFSKKGLPPMIIIYPAFGQRSLLFEMQIEIDLVFIDTSDLLYPNVIGATKYKGVNILLMKTKEWSDKKQVAKMKAFLAKEFEFTNQKKEMYFYFLRRGDASVLLLDKTFSESTFKIANDKYILNKFRGCNFSW